MKEVIQLIEEKIQEIENYPITSQEDEQMHILESACLGQLLRVARSLL